MCMRAALGPHEKGPSSQDLAQPASQRAARELFHRHRPNTAQARLTVRRLDCQHRGQLLRRVSTSHSLSTTQQQQPAKGCKRRQTLPTSRLRPGRATASRLLWGSSGSGCLPHPSTRQRPLWPQEAQDLGPTSGALRLAPRRPFRLAIPLPGRPFTATARPGSDGSISCRVGTTAAAESPPPPSAPPAADRPCLRRLSAF